DLHYFLLLLLTSITALAISAAVNPYCSSRVSISSSRADSPNLSLTPTRLIGTGYVSQTISEVAPPSPPIMLCSSAVTIAPVSLAQREISSLSIGFIENMSTTRQEIPFSLRSLAASRALPTSRPQAI